MGKPNPISPSDQFGRLTALDSEFRGRIRYWRCKCECGNEKHVAGKHLASGRVLSCGCLRRENSVERSRVLLTRHGKSKLGDGRPSREYQSWISMKGRCLYPGNASYKSYGAVGITVCDRWLNSFEAFLEDMGPKPTPEHSIDRIDGTLGYFPENCRWADRKEQAANRRKPPPPKRITHCKRGHEFTDENTYTKPGGVRVCKTCRAERYRGEYLARRARLYSVTGDEISARKLIGTVERR